MPVATVATDTALSSPVVFKTHNKKSEKRQAKLLFVLFPDFPKYSMDKYITFIIRLTELPEKEMMKQSKSDEPMQQSAVGDLSIASNSYSSSSAMPYR